MEKQEIGILEILKSRIVGKGDAESEETRPVKWIQVGKNVWRIVYAD